MSTNYIFFISNGRKPRLYNHTGDLIPAFSHGGHRRNARLCRRIRTGSNPTSVMLSLLSHLMRLWHLSHRRPAKAQAHLLYHINPLSIPSTTSLHYPAAPPTTPCSHTPDIHGIKQLDPNQYYYCLPKQNHACAVRPNHPVRPYSTLLPVIYGFRYFVGPLYIHLNITGLIHLRKRCFIWQCNVLSDISLFDFTQYVVLFESSFFCLTLLNVLLKYQFFHVMLRIVLFENASFRFLFACLI